MATATKSKRGVVRTTILDEAMPVYEFSDRHAIVIHARPGDIFRAWRQLTLDEISFLRPLFWLRMLPSRLSGQPGVVDFPGSMPFVDMALGKESPWILLGEESDRESVMGAIGNFAQPRIEFVTVRDPEEFRRFNDPKYSKTALGVRVVPGGDPASGYTTTMESRTHVPDPAMGRRFALYWKAIKPFEGMMAEGGLRALKRRAEETALTAASTRRKSALAVGLPLAALVIVGVIAYLRRRSRAAVEQESE